MRFIIETKEDITVEETEKLKNSLLHMKLYGENDKHLENNFDFHLKDIIKTIKAEVEFKV